MKTLLAAILLLVSNLCSAQAIAAIAEYTNGSVLTLYSSGNCRKLGYLMAVNKDKYGISYPGCWKNINEKILVEYERERIVYNVTDFIMHPYWKKQGKTLMNAQVQRD